MISTLMQRFPRFAQCAHVMIEEYKLDLSVMEYIREFEELSRRLIADCNLMPYAEVCNSCIPHMI